MKHLDPSLFKFWEIDPEMPIAIFWRHPDFNTLEPGSFYKDHPPFEWPSADAYAEWKRRQSAASI